MRRQIILGWIALGLSTLVTCLWAFWGIVENFHEGWWQPALGTRLLFSLFYITPMLITLALTLLAVRWPKLGAAAFFIGGAWFSWFILAPRWGKLDLAILLSWLPVTALVIGVGLLWWFGRPQPAKLAYLLAAGLPLLVLLAAGAEPAWRVTHRVDDGSTEERLVQGNGVALVWAPEGPGWVRDAKQACSWDMAVQLCAHLSADGMRLEEKPVNIWRLPTVDEAVRSLTRGGQNAGGEWDSAAGQAHYRVRPDKESPLWRVYAETIYWWTATQASPGKAYRVVYNGSVYAMPKDQRYGTIGFRAVREPPSAK